MPYMIETFDEPSNSHVRRDYYEAHLFFLDSHSDVLLACGAKLSDQGDRPHGGLYVVDVEDRAAAWELISHDPFFIHGLFREVRLTRWRKAYLDGACYL